MVSFMAAPRTERWKLQASEEKPMWSAVSMKSPRHPGGGEHGADELNEAGGTPHGVKDIEGGNDAAPGHLALTG